MSRAGDGSAPAASSVAPARPTVAERRALTLAYGATGFYLVLMFLGFLMFTYPVGAQGMGKGSPIYQITLLASVALTALAVRPWENPRRLLTLPVSVTLVLLWCWLSVTWAISPDSAVRRVVQATVIPLASFYILASLGYARFITLLRQASIGQLVLCYLMVLLIPDIGIQLPVVATDYGSAGTWRGAMMDKNTAGAFCAVTVIIFLFDARALRPALRAAMVLAATFFLIKSGSKTAIGISVLAVLGGVAINLYSPAYRRLLIPAAMVLGVLVALTYQWLLAPFREALYDPNAFTGRGQIWAGIWGYIKDHWLLGSGFGSFWSIGPQSPVNQYAEAWWVRETVYVGHNGYLDLWATTGLIGMLLAVAMMIVLPMLMLLVSRSIPRGKAALAGALIIFCAGDNLTESTILNGDAFLNIVLMFALAIIYVPRPVPVREMSARMRPPPGLSSRAA